MLLALLIDVLLLSLAGYVVLLVIAVSYWGASTQPFSVVVSAATGGAFLAFVIVPPTYVVIGYWAASRRRASGSGAAPEEEVPSTDQEVPADPQPHPEQERARHAPPGDGGEDIAQPRSVEDRTAQLPQHERDEDGPPDRDAQDGREHVTRTYPLQRNTVGLIGWIVILAIAVVWEILSLVDPAIPTLSHYVRIVMNPPIGRAALAIAWIAIGFSLFGPR